VASKPGAASFEIDLPRLRSWFGIGVAGNFAGHLEQAGEAGDFVNVAADGGAPKGLFPFYAPGHDSFLSVFPLSHDAIALPSAPDAAARLQVEPEVALACSVSYAADGSVAGLLPFAFGRFNDCSIRLPGAAKIGEKKNWGADSKGVAARFIPLDGADPRNRHCRLAPGLLPPPRRQAPCVRCRQPTVRLFLLRRYTPFGESTHLRAGDQSVVVVYDSARHDREAVAATLDRIGPVGASILRQTVR